MTWYFDPTEQQIDVYDHTDALVAENVQLDGGWDGDYPDEIESVMMDQARAESNIGGSAPISSEYAFLTLFDLLEGNIEQGTPPA